MTSIATTGALSLPISLHRSCKISSKRGVRGGFGVFAVFGEESSLGDKKSSWSMLFEVEDPRSNFPQCKGKFLDVYQALEMIVEILHPLAREYKSVGTMKKELAELQGELAQAHKQAHISEARVVLLWINSLT
ncbi:hypothetical protein CRYUN_Cryun09bG0103900 [Craigia yunnanensis]